MANVLTALREILAADPLLAGEVTAVSGQSITVTLPDGAEIIARGAATVGQRVFVRGALVEGTAPALTIVNIEV